MTWHYFFKHPFVSPCPFCGASAGFRRHPEFPEIVRIECGGEHCGVQPKTEYLLQEYRDELLRTWNRREVLSKAS